MLGQMHEKVVTACPQLRKQLPFGARLREWSQRLPRTVDAEHFADRGCSVSICAVSQYTSASISGVRRLALQSREHRRSKQHIALVAQLSPPARDALPLADGVIDHGATIAWGSLNNAARGEPCEQRSNSRPEALDRELREMIVSARRVDAKRRHGEPFEQSLESGAPVGARIGKEQSR
jgi:hypothetical protein